MHRQTTRQYAQDLPVTGQSSWSWPKKRRPSTSSLLNSFVSTFVLSCTQFIPSFSGLARHAGSLSSRSFINWDRALRSRRFEAFGAFFATVSIVAEGAPFNQEITVPAFIPASGRAVHSRK